MLMVLNTEEGVTSSRQAFLSPPCDSGCTFSNTPSFSNEPRGEHLLLRIYDFFSSCLHKTQASMSGVCKLWPMGHIWLVACFCTTHELRMVFIFWRGCQKRNRRCDALSGVCEAQRAYCLAFYGICGPCSLSLRPTMTSGAGLWLSLHFFHLCISFLRCINKCSNPLTLEGVV